MMKICIKCFKRLTGEKSIKKKFIISKNLEVCEECGRLKHIVLEEKMFHKHPFSQTKKLTIEELQKEVEF